MEIKCKCCGEFFSHDDETFDLIAEGYVSSDSVNTCDPCWDLIQVSEYDNSESFSETEKNL